MLAGLGASEHGSGPIRPRPAGPANRFHGRFRPVEAQAGVENRGTITTSLNYVPGKSTLLGI